MPAVLRSRRRSVDVRGRVGMESGMESGREMMGRVEAGVRVILDRMRAGILLVVMREFVIRGGWR